MVKTEETEKNLQLVSVLVSVNLNVSQLGRCKELEGFFKPRYIKGENLK